MPVGRLRWRLRTQRVYTDYGIGTRDSQPTDRNSTARGASHDLHHGRLSPCHANGDRADDRYHWWLIAIASATFAVASGVTTLAVWRIEKRAPWLLVACGALGARCAWRCRPPCRPPRWHPECGVRRFRVRSFSRSCCSPPGTFETSSPIGFTRNVGVIVGRSNSEPRRGRRSASGAFRPGLGYDLVEPIFSLYGVAGSDEEALARYRKSRDALRLGSPTRQAGSSRSAAPHSTHGARHFATGVGRDDPAFWT
jgi:hypothetical protein